MHAAHGHSNQQRSFPELVGRNAQAASAYVARQGLQPVLVMPNQPMTMDYRPERVRITTDPTGRIVAQVPYVG